MRLILTYCLCAAALAQQTAPVRPFEAASIKPHSGAIRSIGVFTKGTRLIADAENLDGLIAFAYNLRRFEMTDSSPMASSEIRFTVEAKAEGDAAVSRNQFRRMMQLLLADRFGLKFHREKREIDAYALVVAKNGPKFKESAVEGDAVNQYGPAGRDYRFILPKGTMQDLVSAIDMAAEPLGRPVFEHTGLTGAYGLKLIFTPERNSSATPEEGSIGTNLFEALQDQLGLKLEARKESIEVLVVDQAHRPTEN